mmetsp:Transcript_71610/g.210278  ORF Transcript_71610/g.210278 Transcript_71610/m.210278 type:complete len:511 (-) Transcript_71610:2714-4246(-)
MGEGGPEGRQHEGLAGDRLRPRVVLRRGRRRLRAAGPRRRHLRRPRRGLHRPPGGEAPGLPPPRHRQRELRRRGPRGRFDLGLRLLPRPQPAGGLRALGAGAPGLQPQEAATEVAGVRLQPEVELREAAGAANGAGRRPRRLRLGRLLDRREAQVPRPRHDAHAGAGEPGDRRGRLEAELRGGPLRAPGRRRPRLLLAARGQLPRSGDRPRLRQVLGRRRAVRGGDGGGGGHRGDREPRRLERGLPGGLPGGLADGQQEGPRRGRGAGAAPARGAPGEQGPEGGRGRLRRPRLAPAGRRHAGRLHGGGPRDHHRRPRGRRGGPHPAHHRGALPAARGRGRGALHPVLRARPPPRRRRVRARALGARLEQGHGRGPRGRRRRVRARAHGPGAAGDRGHRVPRHGRRPGRGAAPLRLPRRRHRPRAAGQPHGRRGGGAGAPRLRAALRWLPRRGHHLPRLGHAPHPRGHRLPLGVLGARLELPGAEVRARCHLQGGGADRRCDPSLRILHRN